MHFAKIGQADFCKGMKPHEDGAELSSTEAAHRERPSGPRRRKQILEAAQHCFVQHGFHATSMSCIANTADIAVGLIYRYFPSKNTIIAAIVAQEVQDATLIADALEAEQADIVPALISQFRQKIVRRSNREDCALVLEVLAEAARNPEVGRLVSEARSQISHRLRTLVSSAAPQRWTEDEIRKKVDMLLMLLDFSSIKAVLDQSFESGRTCEEFVGYANAIFERDVPC